MKARVFNEDWSANLLKCFNTLVVDEFRHVDRLDFIDLVIHRHDPDVDVGQNAFHLLDLEEVSREKSYGLH